MSTRCPVLQINVDDFSHYRSTQESLVLESLDAITTSAAAFAFPFNANVWDNWTRHGSLGGYSIYFRQPSAHLALYYSCQILSQLKEHNRQHSCDLPLSLRLVLGMGEVQQTAGQWTGEVLAQTRCLMDHSSLKQYLGLLTKQNISSWVMAITADFHLAWQKDETRQHPDLAIEAPPWLAHDFVDRNKKSHAGYIWNQGHWLAVASEPVQANSPSSQLIPARYHNWMLQQLAFLESRVLANEPMRLRLQGIYEPLFAVWTETKDEDQANLQNKESRRQPLAELLTHPDQRHFLILGDPGSGKTTFANYHTLDQLKHGQVLPILLSLGKFATWLQRHTGERGPMLLEWAGSAFAEFDVDQQHLLQANDRILWLLDGLDEIFDEGIRLRAASIIGRWFAGAGNQQRCLLTGRPHAAAQQGVAAALAFKNARIQPFNTEERDAFVNRWFRAVVAENPNHANTRAASLIESLNQHPQLRQMQTNPLLLTIIATIFYFGRKLPERRVELYAKAVEIMLANRFGSGAGGNPDLVDKMTLALMHVARAMMGAQERQTDKATFEQALITGFFGDSRPTHQERLDLKKMQRNLVNHSGLIQVLEDPPIYQFSHLGFQEYLTARFFAHGQDPLTKLKPYLTRDAWREVVQLTAGCLFEARVGRLGENFVTALQKLAETEKEPQLLALAVAAVAESPEGSVSREVDAGLKWQALTMLGSKKTKPASGRIALGRALGHLGDPRLGMLNKQRWVWLNAGSFTMGDGTRENNPPHQVQLSSGFYMGKYPVTNQEYRDFVNDGGYEREEFWDGRGWAWLNLTQEQFDEWFQTVVKKSWEGAKPDYFKPMMVPRYWHDPRFNQANQPVVGVSWFEARAYCKWLEDVFSREKTGAWSAGRVWLPSEAAWEYGARGQEGRTYPWGDAQPTAELACFEDRSESAPVGCYPQGATPQGLADMAGNVWEWCADQWDERAYSRREGTTIDPLVADGDPDLVVLRGGSWDFPSQDLVATIRGGHWPWDRNPDVGFRCCLAAAEPG